MLGPAATCRVRQIFGGHSAWVVNETDADRELVCRVKICSAARKVDRLRYLRAAFGVAGLGGKRMMALGRVGGRRREENACHRDHQGHQRDPGTDQGMRVGATIQQFSPSSERRTAFRRRVHRHESFQCPPCPPSSDAGAGSPYHSSYQARICAISLVCAPMMARESSRSSLLWPSTCRRRAIVIAPSW